MPYVLAEGVAGVSGSWWIRICSNHRKEVSEMGLFDTTAEKEAAERLKCARKHLWELRDWIGKVDEEMERFEKDERYKGKSFPIGWCSTMMEKTLSVYNEVARGNGALMVRSTK